MKDKKSTRREEIHSVNDRFGAVRDPGATPRRILKNDKLAVVHSDEESPNSEFYEAYEDEPSLQGAPSAAPREGENEDVHKTTP